MSKSTNCVSVSCDRCGHQEFLYSLQHAENVGWGIDTKIDEDTFDLCPKCNNVWNAVVGKFLNNQEEMDENSIKIQKALDVAYSHGQTAGDHHKAWVIDQMVRRLLGDDYAEWIKEYKHEDRDDNAYTWDEGVAP